MQFPILGLTALLCQAFAANATSCDSLVDSWSLAKERQQVRLYQRQKPVDLSEVMVITELRTSLTAFILLLRGTQKGPEWIANASTIMLLDRPKPNQDLVVTRFDAPWPIRNRDMVTLSTFNQDPENLTLTLTVTEASDKYPKVDGWIRMKNVRAIWQLSPLPSGLIEICYRGSADPAGFIPLWLAKQLQKDGTFSTFVRLRQILLKDQYQQGQVVGIQEPNTALRTKISNNP